MHKEGLETYNGLIKIFILLLLDRIEKLELQLLDYNYMCIRNNLHDQSNYNFHYSLPITITLKHVMFTIFYSMATIPFCLCFTVIVITHCKIKLF